MTHRTALEVCALWLLSEIAMHRDPLDLASAATYSQQALALAEALGMHRLVAHCHHRLGRLYGQPSRTCKVW